MHVKEKEKSVNMTEGENYNSQGAFREETSSIKLQLEITLLTK